MTRRQEMIEILKNHKTSFQEFCNIYQIKMDELQEDITFIQKKFRHKLKQEPPKCNFCGFVYKERSRIKKPSRCPECKHEDIIPPLFWIKEK